MRRLALTQPQAILLLAVAAKAEAAEARLPVGHDLELAVLVQSPLLLAPELQ